jgi:nitrite reductase (cytochrome c-552)
MMEGMTSRTRVVTALCTGAAIASLWIATDGLAEKQAATGSDADTVELTEDTLDPEIWGQNFPLQYEAYLKTVDMQRTRFGGSEAFPQTPSDADPRSFVAKSMIEHEPRLKEMWAGYAFSIDYREKRGHAYMLEDQTLTERQKVGQPGTCLHCHASVVGAYRRLGDGDLTRGFEALNAMTYAEARTNVDHPIACIDCHDPSSMALRISRPAFMEGIAAYKASQGVANYDVNTMATRAEMRSYVCGQCHVEYYFSKDDKRLIFPWSQGLLADQMLAYYDRIDFSDWTHKRTGTKMLKAQHPEFELWNQGIHGRAGVACADCHMPYQRVGASKVSDHQVRSPLLQVNASCQGCHAVPAAELLARAERIQARNHQLEGEALQAIVELIDDLEAAKNAGAGDAALADARKSQRHAQFLIDFVISENSTGFHADQETARLLHKGIEEAQRGRRSLSPR